MMKFHLLVPLLTAILTRGATASSNSSSWFSSSSNKYGAYGYNFFADSQSTYYDGYQQAWRYLGWYVKCGYPSDRYNDGQDSKSHSGSQDGNGYYGNNYCQRYLIWAAVSSCMSGLYRGVEYREQIEDAV